MSERASSLRRAMPSVAATVLALGVCFIAIAVTRVGWGGAAAAYRQMLWGGIGDLPAFFERGVFSALTRPWGEASVKAALLTFTGLSVAVAFSVGLFNIGAQGQMLVGALAAAVVGAGVGLPPVLHVPLCILAAAAGGGLYALIAAALRLERGVHEVLSTIMLNWIAVSLIESWLVVGPLRAASAGTGSRSGTNPILASAHLPRMLADGSRLNLGFPMAVVAALLVWVWLYRSWHGFETRTAGLGATAAETAGIPVRRRIYQAMMLSGALAGVAGAILVMGTEFQYPGILSAPYGFDGIAMAMLGQSNPLGVALVSLVFGVLRAGGTRMQLFGVHKSFPELIQGLALLLIAGRGLWERLFAARARVQPPTKSSAEETL